MPGAFALFLPARKLYEQTAKGICSFRALRNHNVIEMLGAFAFFALGSEAKVSKPLRACADFELLASLK